MAAASPLHYEDPSREPSQPDIGRAYAHHVTRMQPELLASIGMTTDEFEAACNDTRSLEEAVKVGWISAAEQRFIEARATREDLLELGHKPGEIEALLAEQQACASSS